MFLLDFLFDLCLINFHHHATPNFLNFLNYHCIYLSLSIYLSIYISINPFSSIFICQSINSPSPFPKYQYIIAADPGAGIGLVLNLECFTILREVVLAQGPGANLLCIVPILVYVLPKQSVYSWSRRQLR